MIEKILGLDIGISSIGWAIVEHDSDNSKNNKILKSGVRIFTQAENPKTGESLALPRRVARGKRRTIRRKAVRLRAIKLQFIKFLGLQYKRVFSDNTSIYHDKGKKELWLLRDRAVKRKLDSDEFARVLTHISKRRGYKSNRKSEEKKDSDNKKVLKEIEKNTLLLKKYETIGQAIYNTTKNSDKRRNVDGNYNFSVSREMLLDEIKTIFDKQRFYHNELATKEFEEQYIKLAFSQKDFTSVEHMVGKCIFESKEKRAPKQSFSASEFIAVTEIINNKIVDIDGYESTFNKEQIESILNLCLEKRSITYKSIRKELNIPMTTLFKRVAYHDKEGKYLEPNEAEKVKFKNPFEKGYHELKKIFENNLSKDKWKKISKNIYLLDEIAKIFTYYKSDEDIKNHLETLFKKHEIDIVMIEALINSISFNKFIHLSIKAVNIIVPKMKDGLTYDKACKEVGYENKTGTKQKYLRPLNKQENKELTNPVVKRALAQCRKVINAVISEYGQLDKIHIELTREIKKSFPDRKKVEKAQKTYREEKEKLVGKFFELYGRNPKGNELLKFRLYEEQDGYCFYHDKTIDLTRLNERGYLEIDHILPFSRSLDDSMSNKILCFTKENQDKKNQTPFEYFTNIGRNWHSFEEKVKTAPRLGYAKKKKLIKKNFDESSSKDFKERNKNDTSYMSKYIKNYIENNLELISKKPQKVFTRNGSLTALLRHNWGVGEKNRDNHYHHAEDAIVLAFSTQSEVQKLSTISAQHEGLIYEKVEKKSKKIRFKPPMENFRNKIKKSIDEIFVSYTPRKKVTGAAHKETVYSKNLEKQKGSFEVNGGLAENGEVKRVDIFKKDNKFHFVFIYPSDFLKLKLPDTTIKGVKIDDSFEFLFSLFKDEFIKIKQKNKNCVSGYFKFPLSDGRLAISNHFDANFNPTHNRFSTGSLEYIKKYHVGILGACYEIKSEKREGTKIRRK